MDDFSQVAARWGIDVEYLDAYGCRRAAMPTAVARIVAALKKAKIPSQNLDVCVPPRCAYQGRTDARLWLLAVQLYSVRSKRNWGHGDFTDLANLVEAACELGAAGIGLNPLHALFPDRAEQASPYAPNSRIFLNPLYIDVEAIEEFPSAAKLAFQDRLEKLRESDLVAYADVSETKMTALRQAYHAFVERGSAERHADLNRFRRERGVALERFAAFETLRLQFNAPWWEWPLQWRSPTTETLQTLRFTRADEFAFNEFLQWIADRQLQACSRLARQRGLSVGLYLDVAVGIDPAGADAWSEQECILHDLAIGAPPDLLNTAGQNWGIVGFNPHALVVSSYSPFKSLLSAVMRHAGAIRLDHILGLKRLYVIPRGMGAREGAYLRYPLDALLDVIREQSEKHECIVIGEDLGTVPAGFRETLSAWGVWSYRVMVFEREGGRFLPPEHYPRMALATFATHDLPTFGGWMSGVDLVTKRSLGQNPGETESERDSARAAMREVLAGINESGDFAKVARYLAATPSRLVVISIEDAMGVADQTNIPGTVDEYPNWRHRLPISIEQFKKSERAQQLARIFEDTGRRDVCR